MAVVEKDALTFTAEIPEDTKVRDSMAQQTTRKRKIRWACRAGRGFWAPLSSRVRCAARNERKTGQLSCMERDQETRNQTNRRELRKALARRLEDYYRVLSAELPPRFREMLERLAGKKQEPNS